MHSVPGGCATYSYSSNASGTGNDSYLFTLLKFNPSLGTLTGVAINCDVQLNYVYSIGNTRVNSTVFRTRIIRTDDISSTAIDPSSISQSNQTSLLATMDAGNTTVQVGPSTMNYTVSDIITDSRVANLMGAGTVDFNYINSSLWRFPVPRALTWILHNSTIYSTSA